ncbi:30S ribosomal protein S4 [bacterium]|nr:30S ribosomal protein S4 [bacterium]
MKNAVCRKCRRAGLKLFLKGERCYTQKCPMIRKPYPPGVHKNKFSQLSDYGKQLREVQKIKWTYGISETQFKRYLEEAKKQKELIVADALKQILERRIDNVIFLAGFTISRRQARQLVSHGHFYLNGRKITIPSYLVKPNDVISLKEKTKEIKLIEKIKKPKENYQPPKWLEVDFKNLTIKIKKLPLPEEINLPFDYELAIEFYSR